MRRLLTVILIFPSFFSSSQLDLETIAAQYPIAKGSTWTYATTDTVQKDSLNCLARGKSVITIVSLQDSGFSRVARAEVNSSVTDVTGDRGCESRFAGSNLGWMYVMVFGKVYEGSVFADDLVRRARSEGATPFEERNIAPAYVFPLRAGRTWTGKYDQYEVFSSAPVQTAAGTFQNCFKIVRSDKDYPEKRTESTFCLGIGPVSEKTTSPGHTFNTLLTSYTIP
jgi:hypothetical protein